MVNLYGVQIGDKLKSKCKGGKYYQLKGVAEAKVMALKRGYWGNKDVKLVTYYLLTEDEYLALKNGQVNDGFEPQINQSGQDGNK